MTGLLCPAARPTHPAHARHWTPGTARCTLDAGRLANTLNAYGFAGESCASCATGRGVRELASRGPSGDEVERFTSCDGHAEHPPDPHPGVADFENNFATRRHTTNAASAIQAAVATICQSGNLTSVLFRPLPIGNARQITNTFRRPSAVRQRHDRFGTHRQSVSLRFVIESRQMSA